MFPQKSARGGRAFTGAWTAARGLALAAFAVTAPPDDARKAA
ncbi:hypothetical protein [Nonomuraea wenchangensis]